MDYILISHNENESILIFCETVTDMLEKKKAILENKMAVETYFNSFHRYVITVR